MLSSNLNATFHLSYLWFDFQQYESSYVKYEEGLNRAKNQSVEKTIIPLIHLIASYRASASE